MAQTCQVRFQVILENHCNNCVLVSPDVELLDLVNGSDGDRGVRGKGQTVFVRLSVEGAHVLHLG